MKKFLLMGLQFFILLPLSFALSADLGNEYFIFLGNPGSGKSSIVNAIIGEQRAKAGVSPGTGLTLLSDKYEHNGKYYVDTPGLDDPASRLEAAKQIELALKENGRYHLIFVVTLEAGRVKASDVATLVSIMDAIENPHKSYSVIVNKVTAKEKHLLSTPESQSQVCKQLNSGTHKTEKFYYIDVDRVLEDDLSNTKLLTVDEKARDFISQSAVIAIAKENVHEIATNDFNALKEEYEMKLKKQEEAHAEELKNAVAPVIHYHQGGSNGGGGCTIF